MNPATSVTQSAFQRRGSLPVAAVTGPVYPRDRALTGFDRRSREIGCALKLLIISDTHVPVRARDLPPPVWAAVDAVDVVIHAGDWVEADLLDRLSARAARVVAVWGNNDGPQLRARLPEVARVELDGVRVAVVHEAGPAAGRERRCARAYPGVDVLIFGHSHIPWDSTASGGLRLLNPGSPTDRRRQPTHTWMTAEITGGRLAAVTLHRDATA